MFGNGHFLHTVYNFKAIKYVSNRLLKRYAWGIFDEDIELHVQSVGSIVVNEVCDVILESKVRLFFLVAELISDVTQL